LKLIINEAQAKLNFSLSSKETDNKGGSS